MKKAVLINLLVITSVVAIFVFTGMWYMRPGVPSEVLEMARQRQSQPLLEISEPIKLPAKEEVAAVQDVVDQAALAEQMLPTLRDQLSVSLEDQLYERLKGRFTVDQELLSQLSDILAPPLASRLLPSDYVGSQQLAASVSSLRGDLQKEFDKKVDSLKAELLWEQGKSNLALRQDLELYKKELNEEMQAYVPQLVDQMLSQVVHRVYDELSLNKETYLAELQQRLPETLDEEQLFSIYAMYKNQMVIDLVPVLLDSLQEPVSKMVASLVADLTVDSPSVLKESIAIEESKPVAPSVKPAVVMAEEPVIDVLTPVVPSVKPAIVMIEEPVVEESVVLKKGQPVITLPSFAEDEPVVFVEPEVYMEQREVLRNQAIDEILKRINAE